MLEICQVFLSPHQCIELDFVKDSEEVFSFASPRSSPRSSISSRSSSLRSVSHQNYGDGEDGDNDNCDELMIKRKMIPKVSSPRPASSVSDQDCFLSRPTSISSEKQRYLKENWSRKVYRMVTLTVLVDPHPPSPPPPSSHLTR